MKWKIKTISILLAGLMITSSMGMGMTAFAEETSSEPSTEVLSDNNEIKLAATDVSLNQKAFSGKVGDSVQLTATVLPEESTEEVVWSSSNPSAVSVTNGLVEILQEADEPVTITAAVGELSATCTVTIEKEKDWTLELNTTQYTLAEGNSFKLEAIGVPDDITVSFSSDEPSVATVSEDGTVTAVKEGTANITVIAGTQTAICSITVEKSIVEVSAVQLNKTTETVTQGSTKTLTATVLPGDAENPEITWSSSDTAIATVTSKGVVKGVKAGTVTITAQTSNGKKATCKVTVLPLASGITVNKTALTVVQTKTATLTATVTPTNAANKTVTWSSSNTDIATVTSKGVVKGVKAGTVTITAQTSNGKKATCKVTVLPLASGITVNKTALTVVQTKTATLTATVTPTNAANKTVTWSSSNTDIATVTSKGVVKGVKAGTVTITAQTSNGKKATCKVTVQPLATGVTLSKTALKLEQTKAATLKATVSPTNAANKTVTWTSSNKTIATVTSAGKVTAKKPGTATITAKTSNGKKATCKVTVIPTVTSVKLSQKTLTLVQGKAATLKATPLPTNAARRTVTWSTSNKAIATVSTAGKVTAKKAGVATITAKVANGKKATCKVTVKLPAPTNVKAATASLTSIKVSWKKVANASGYYIYRSASKTGAYKKIATVKGGTKVSYINKKLTAGKVYYYKVSAYHANKNCNSAMSAIVSAKARLLQPVVKTARASWDAIMVSWKKIAGATSYKVYRATSKNGTYKILATVKTTSYKNTGTIPGKSYFYKVVAVGKKPAYNATSEIVEGKSMLATPSFAAYEIDTTKVYTYWYKIAGASGYEVFRSTKRNSGFKKIKTITKADQVEYTNTGRKMGVQYFYKIRPYYLKSGKKYYGNFSTVAAVIMPFSKGYLLTDSFDEQNIGSFSLKKDSTLYFDLDISIENTREVSSGKDGVKITIYGEDYSDDLGYYDREVMTETIRLPKGRKSVGYYEWTSKKEKVLPAGYYYIEISSLTSKKVSVSYRVSASQIFATTLTIPKTLSVKTDNYKQIPILSASPINGSAAYWASSNTAIAHVDNQGLVYPNKPGKCTITATLKNGKKYKCVVTVTDPSPEMNYSSYTLCKGESFKAKLLYTKKAVNWSSSNTSVATVSSNGTVKAKGVGSCKVYAKSGGKTYSMTVKVEYENPDYFATIDGYYTRDNYFLVRFKNFSKKPIIVYSADSKVEQFDYKSFDRTLHLPKYSNAIIPAGQTKSVRFYVNGDNTYWDPETYKLLYKFKFDGKTYNANAYYDVTESEYKKGNGWYYTYWNYHDEIDGYSLNE